MSMDEAAAIDIATAARAAHAVPSGHALRGTERRIIELEEEAPTGGRLVRDVRTWIVRFAGGMAWTELAVDESSGAVVRVERSRAQ